MGSIGGMAPGGGIYSAVPSDTLIVVADAHLGARGVPPAERLHAFLDRLPDLGDHLVINGDLFAFLFVHGRVLPRHAFPTLAALVALRRRGVALTVIGGNHDRWARDLWEREVGAAFHPRGTRLTVANRQIEVRHGDGLHEPDRLSRLLHWLVARRAVVGAVRWMHPDVLHPLVRRLGDRLGARGEDREVASRLQERWARAHLAHTADVDVLVLGHTHVATAIEVAPGRWYVNPGAWLDGGAYAVIPPDGPPRLSRA
jgi:UDP-2,3-diacylglucosamine pyrophosphatase LpxH